MDNDASIETGEAGEQHPATKTAFAFNRETGAFIGLVDADMSPLEPGVYHLPAGATFIAPPAIPEGFTAIFDGEAWELQEVPTPPEPEPLSEAELAARAAAQLLSAVDAMMDAKAQERRYDSRFTVAIRTGYPGPYQTEAIAFATWMDSVNEYCYAVEAAVLAGERGIPTVAELLAELPTFEWPQ